jgi:hypothetical protein
MNWRDLSSIINILPAFWVTAQLSTRVVVLPTTAMDGLGGCWNKSSCPV